MIIGCADIIVISIVLTIILVGCFIVKDYLDSNF